MGRLIGVCVGILVGLMGCVETEITMIINQDGSGKAMIQQVIPRVMLKDVKTPYMHLDNNRLILRDEAEAREILASPPGVQVVNIAVTDITDIKNYRLPIDMRGIRHVRAEFMFDNIDDLSLSHFQFRLKKGVENDYFVLYVSKALGNQEQIEQPYGGMGVFTGSATEGRNVTFKIMMPSRTIAHNATEQNWNHLTWVLPVGVLFNSVQEEIFAWAKLAPSTKGLEAWWQELKWKLVGDAWLDPDKFPPYFVLPAIEPNPRDLYKD